MLTVWLEDLIEPSRLEELSLPPACDLPSLDLDHFSAASREQIATRDSKGEPPRGIAPHTLTPQHKHKLTLWHPLNHLCAAISCDGTT